MFPICPIFPKNVGEGGVNIIKKKGQKNFLVEDEVQKIFFLQIPVTTWVKPFFQSINVKFWFRKFFHIIYIKNIYIYHYIYIFLIFQIRAPPLNF
jgi:hypothetical protein